MSCWTFVFFSNFVYYILLQNLEQAGFQFRCVDVRVRAAEILRLNYGHNSPYKDTSPGHNWLSGFLKRHPGKFHFIASLYSGKQIEYIYN